MTFLGSAGWHKYHSLEPNGGTGATGRIFAKICSERPTHKKGNTGTPQEVLMSNLQAFLLGVTFAWSPSLIVLAWILRQNHPEAR